VVKITEWEIMQTLSCHGITIVLYKKKAKYTFRCCGKNSGRSATLTCRLYQFL